jgi:hypothetical protein
MADFVRTFAILALVLVTLTAVTFLRAGITGAYTYANESNSGLGIWDQTDAEGGSQTARTYPESDIIYNPQGGCPFKSSGQWNVDFFANYTNTTSDPIDNVTGNCTIRFNKTGSWTAWDNMTYNITSGFWGYNTTLTYKGVRAWEVNCTSDTYDDINLSDTNGVSISNTAPCIFADEEASGYLPSAVCNEDDVCTYAFSQNVTDDDKNDDMTYICPNPFSGFSIDSATGVWTVDISFINETESYTVTLQVNDTAQANDITAQNITVNAVNDKPIFDDLPPGATEDQEFNASSATTTITATDEENHIPFKFNLSIVSCQKAEWVENRTENCDLFNFTINSNNIVIDDFTPTNWDVGEYLLNFTVEDSGSEYPQFGVNSTNQTLMNFTVTNVNDKPSITAINGTSITMNQSDFLYVIFNGTDIENDTLTFNATTLVWNDTNLSYQPYENPSLFAITKNDTYYPNESAYGIMNYTLTNSHVGNYTLNITVTDDGTNPSNLTYYILVNFTILNVNDPPALENITGNLTGVQEMPFYYYFNASDPDMLTAYGDNLTFGFNFTWCQTINGTENCNDFDENSAFEINKTGNTSAFIYILAARNDTGNYTMNLTVTDDDGLTNWTLVNLTIIPDWPPVVDAAIYLEMNQTESRWYDFNVTDAENDTLNITYRVLTRDLKETPINIFPVNISNATYPPYYNITMNYTPVTNDQVGNYTLEINATDVWNRSTTHLINVTVWNVNDPPQIINFTECTSSSTYPLNLSIAENEQNCLKLTDPDIDLLTPAGDSMNYTFAFINCTTSGDLPPGGNCSGEILMYEYQEIGYLNFTAENESWQGNYTYNLTVSDSENKMDYALVNISIQAVNDEPTLISLVIVDENSNGTNMTYYFPITSQINLTENVPYNISINAVDEEDDTPFYYNASFECALLYGSDCGLFAMNKTSGKTNFTADIDQVGNYSINFTVKDSGNVTQPYNATGWQLVNFTVEKVNHAPVIGSLYPFGYDYDADEGTEKRFQYTAYDNQDYENLTCHWYINWSLAVGNPPTINPVEDCNGTGGADLKFWDYNVTYDDALNYTQGINLTVTLVVLDPGGLNDTQSINVSFIHINRPPRFLQDIDSPIKWATQTSTTPINLSMHFKDDAGEKIIYTYLGATHLAGVEFTDTNQVTLTAGTWSGTDWIVITANDSEYNVSSNNVTLVIEYNPPERTPSPATSVPTPRVASLQIIVPEIIIVDVGKVSKAKVLLYNDGQFDLNDINLSATTKESNISLELDDTFIDKLVTGENYTTWLNITTGDLDVNKTYLLWVWGNVSSPIIGESATITLRTNPINKTILEIEIVFVKDLFEENPECMELFGLILEAENSLNKGDIEEARRLTTLARENCQDMIDYAKLKRNYTGTGQPAVAGQIILNPFFIMGFVILLMAFTMLGYWLMIRRQPRAQSEAI